MPSQSRRKIAIDFNQGERCGPCGNQTLGERSPARTDFHTMAARLQADRIMDGTEHGLIMQKMLAKPFSCPRR
jgi:hypothetical protein